MKSPRHREKGGQIGRVGGGREKNEEPPGGEEEAGGSRGGEPVGGVAAQQGGEGEPETGEGGGWRMVESGGEEEQERDNEVAEEDEQPGGGGEWLEDGEDIGHLPRLLHQDGQAVLHERDGELHSFLPRHVDTHISCNHVIALPLWIPGIWVAGDCHWNRSEVCSFGDLLDKLVDEAKKRLMKCRAGHPHLLWHDQEHIDIMEQAAALLT